MTPTLHPYPAYHPSCVPWLGDVPEHWEVRRLGTLLHRAYTGGLARPPLRGNLSGPGKYKCRGKRRVPVV